MVMLHTKIEGDVTTLPLFLTGMFTVFYQILHGVSVLQKLPELASDITNPEAQSLYSQMTQKHYKR